MNVTVHKDFEKQLAKLPKRQRDRAINAIGLFIDQPLAPALRNHALTGEWAGYRSISVGGDLRLHFRTIDSTTAYFVAVGSHSQLYK